MRARSILLAAGPATIPEALTAQLLRFDVASSTGGNTGAREIDIRGPDPDTAT